MIYRLPSLPFFFLLKKYQWVPQSLTYTVLPPTNELKRIGLTLIIIKIYAQTTRLIDICIPYILRTTISFNYMEIVYRYKVSKSVCLFGGYLHDISFVLKRLTDSDHHLDYVVKG